MIRREIIKLIGLGGAWLLSGGRTLAQPLSKVAVAAKADSPPPAQRVAEASRQIELLRAFVAGYQYHRGAEVEHELLPEVPLRLVREPENRYDELAIALYYKEVRIGYVPRYHNSVLARLLDTDIPLMAKVATIDRGASTWERLEVVVSMMREETSPMEAIAEYKRYNNGQA